ncbi:vacuolar protein sorting 55 [Cokeromyces recurvatus]|uniref:vacuolar protein sorting 55 n=1 Tax=Cokeromyces recurvatus TaxID=90255 RepID=UPI002220B53B|nr:vacuolar protein sorting 55 [Cokeromyces recurvatus]KAI7904009.1 vacuolar protein sorting 55 [Cokeromyces recurvatus]
MAAGLRSIISLAFVLAIGFLLVILSCALYYNWWPLLVVATYILAPLPNALCTRCAGEDDVMSGYYNSGIIDAGHFITGIFIVTGFCLPLVLAHAEVITVPAMIMSIAGGLLVYGTIITYTHFFAHQDDSF